MVVQIGTADGGTLFAFTALAHPQATIISIDLPGGADGGGYPRWRRLMYRSFASEHQEMHRLRGDSHSPTQRLRPGTDTQLPADGFPLHRR